MNINPMGKKMTNLIDHAMSIANERPARIRPDRELAASQAAHLDFRRECVAVEIRGECGRFTADQVVRQRALLAKVAARASARKPKLSSIGAAS